MGATLGGMALRAEAQSMTTRPKRPRNYSGVMLPLCMVVLATLPAFVVGENRTVRSSADFFEALAVPNISAIHLANDITLQVVDAPPRYGHMARYAGFPFSTSAHLHLTRSRSLLSPSTLASCEVASRI